MKTWEGEKGERRRGGATNTQASWPHVLRAVPKKIGAVFPRTSVAVGPFLRAPTPAHRVSTQLHGSRWGAMAGAKPGGWGGERGAHTQRPQIRAPRKSTRLTVGVCGPGCRTRGEGGAPHVLTAAGGMDGGAAGDRQAHTETEREVKQRVSLPGGFIFVVHSRKRKHTRSPAASPPPLEKLSKGGKRQR